MEQLLFTGYLRYEFEKSATGKEIWTVNVDGFESGQIGRDYNLSKLGQYHVKMDRRYSLAGLGNSMGLSCEGWDNWRAFNL
jgi:hypothetical protein